MRSNADACIIAVPWYEEGEFQRICALTPELAPTHARYEDWERQARQCLIATLASGRAVAIIMIRPDQYLAWLGGRPNSLEMRHRYVTSLALGIGGLGDGRNSAPPPVAP